MNHCFSNYPCLKYIHEHTIYNGEFTYDGTFHYDMKYSQRTFSEQYMKIGFIYILDQVYPLFYRRNIDGIYENCATSTVINSPLCIIYEKRFTFNTEEPLRDGQEIFINNNKGCVFRNL